MDSMYLVTLKSGKPIESSSSSTLTNGTTDDPDDEDNGKEILEMFESSTDLKYNEKSATFLLIKI